MKQIIWKRYPDVERWIQKKINQAVEKHPLLQTLEKKIYEGASIHLKQLCDHLVFPYHRYDETFFTDFSYIKFREDSSLVIYHNKEADFPMIVLDKKASFWIRLGISCDNLENFLECHGLNSEIQGEYYEPLRYAFLPSENSVEIMIVERKGSQDVILQCLEKGHQKKYEEALDLWKQRPRIGDEDKLFDEAFSRAKQMIDLVGVDQAGFLVLECERSFWESKSRAARIQKRRQDQCGLGWANRDHHTFRSSRKYFHRVIGLFTLLGFFMRERFYAGKDAGWGAQVMESKGCRSVLFLDVDLVQEELSCDFEKQVLNEIHELGTIGLWCALHGESILEAGMHHLEGQFAFDKLKKDLLDHGIEMMLPFSDEPYLKQAFTKAEMWKVDEQRIEKIYKEKKITENMRDQFLLHGAIGSHLENLERKEGYKGFNQKNVSEIITATDPKKNFG